MVTVSEVVTVEKVSLTLPHPARASSVGPGFWNAYRDPLDLDCNRNTMNLGLRGSLKGPEVTQCFFSDRCHLQTDGAVWRAVGDEHEGLRQKSGLNGELIEFLLYSLVDASRH
jgi:hypothetical protein